MHAKCGCVGIRYHKLPPRVSNPDSLRIKQAKNDTLFKAQTLKANPIQGEKCKNSIATHKPLFIRFPNILRDGSVIQQIICLLVAGHLRTCVLADTS